VRDSNRNLRWWNAKSSLPTSILDEIQINFVGNNCILAAKSLGQEARDDLENWVTARKDFQDPTQEEEKKEKKKKRGQETCILEGKMSYYLMRHYHENITYIFLFHAVHFYTFPHFLMIIINITNNSTTLPLADQQNVSNIILSRDNKRGIPQIFISVRKSALDTRSPRGNYNFSPRDWRPDLFIRTLCTSLPFSAISIPRDILDPGIERDHWPFPPPVAIHARS